MREIFVASDNIFSPLGLSTAENFAALKKNNSGIKLHTNKAIAPDPFYASIFTEFPHKANILEKGEYTRFELSLLETIHGAIQNTGIHLSDDKTILILSSTKGNISMLESGESGAGLESRISLPESARLIASHFGAAREPIIISHACISGLLALITGMRILRWGIYDHAVIAGADMITRFILSGFQSFQAVSSLPCRPFDAERNGVTLGEASATVVLSTSKNHSHGIRLAGGSTSNDANHISGPSRTGEELSIAMKKAILESNLSAKNIDFISAHGTATLYNDEMEAKAIYLAGLEDKPVNSLKGYYGHTLGAAGLIESIISMQSMRENLFIATAGYSKPGTSRFIQVSDQAREGNFRNCLKTASGFGGCNAALVMSRE
ncbi:MAG: beta-ketoacyl-[acyl-carrier-protein] synthase family protein [Chitinophagales bacterium]